MKRGREWRRAKESAKAKKSSRIEAIRNERRSDNNSWKNSPAEKSWKMMYTRSEKIVRARQLGFDYPRKTQRQVIAEHSDGDE